MSTLDKLREHCSGDEAEIIAEVLEDSECEIRGCTGDCAGCRFIQNCFN